MIFNCKHVHISIGKRGNPLTSTVRRAKSLTSTPNFNCVKGSTEAFPLSKMRVALVVGDYVSVSFDDILSSGIVHNIDREAKNAADETAVELTQEC